MTSHHSIGIHGSNFHGGSLGDLRGVTSPFVQVLDESMCVIREDICDWLQRYIFNDAGVSPLDDPADLLERLKSGVWLARLAYKLHFKVLSENVSECSRGVKVTFKEHKLYASLRGTGPSSALGQVTSRNLPEFTTALMRAAKSPLSECDTAIRGFVQPPTNQKTSPFGNSVSSESRVVMWNRWNARSNVAEFLKWCHDLGISETVLFESNGLVHRTEEKNVLLTLMDLARLASRFGLCELPELVRMEKEIEALEAAAASANDKLQVPTTTGAMTPYCQKVDIGTYAACLADRKTNGTSPERPSSSLSSDIEVSSVVSNISSDVNSDPVVSYFSNAFFTTTKMLQTDLGGEENPSEIEMKVDLSTHFNGTDSVDDACQTNVNKAEKVTSYANTLTSGKDRKLTSTGTDSTSGTTTDISVMSSLPPRKTQKTSISRMKPRGNVSKLPIRQSRVPVNRNTGSSVVKVEVAKRSTSAADIRELSRSRVKRRNIRQDMDCQLSSKGHSSEVQDTSVSVRTKIDSNEISLPHPLSQFRFPLTDHNRMTQISKPLSISSTSSKHSSSGFVSHASSCSDLTAEVQKHTAQCTCCSRNRLIRLDEGRYQMGNRIYYLRRFRSHIMVRVGGGWLTLSEFLDRYDPCRQKEGSFHSLNTSHSNLAANIMESGPAVRISASKILKEWPSTNPAVKENYTR